MVLGLIDFLLGGKKKNKVPKSGQVAVNLSSVGGDINSNNSDLTGTQIGNESSSKSVAGNKISSQSSEMKFESVSSSNQNLNSVENNLNSSNQSNIPTGKHRSVSEVISKMYSELKNTNEKITNIVSDVKKLESSVNQLGHRLDDLEENKKVSDGKLEDMDRNMTKFLSLYELINNQYNPFVEQSNPETKQITIDSNSNSKVENENSSDLDVKIGDVNEKKNLISENKVDVNDLDSTLLNLDTLNIEEAAGDAVPLVSLKNNTNSLVTILSWLEYLIKKEGVEATRDSLRYYTETLKWITPEVFFDLDKYLRGMKDKSNLSGNESLTVKDHIVSLYFISKLNEKVLDENLTRAVLQIIKE